MYFSKTWNKSKIVASFVLRCCFFLEYFVCWQEVETKEVHALTKVELLNIYFVYTSNESTKRAKMLVKQTERENNFTHVSFLFVCLFESIDYRIRSISEVANSCAML